VLAYQVKARQVITQHILTVKQHETGKWYLYRRLVRILKNIQLLKNSTRVSNSSQSLNEELVELSSRQASKQASEHSSKSKQAGAKLMYNTKRYHVQRGYRSRHS